jgi:hypothetical protein
VNVLDVEAIIDQFINLTKGLSNAQKRMIHVLILVLRRCCPLTLIHTKHNSRVPLVHTSSREELIMDNSNGTEIKSGQAVIVVIDTVMHVSTLHTRGCSDIKTFLSFKNEHPSKEILEKWKHLCR